MFNYMQTIDLICRDAYENGEPTPEIAYEDVKPASDTRTGLDMTPLNFEEYKALSDTEKREYLQDLKILWNASSKMIADLFDIPVSTAWNLCANMCVRDVKKRHYTTQAEREAYYAWASGKHKIEGNTATREAKESTVKAPGGEITLRGTLSEVAAMLSALGQRSDVVYTIKTSWTA